MNQVLLTSRKNEIFEVVEGAGLDPARLEWMEVASLHGSEQRVSRLVLKTDPDFYFQFDYLRGQDWARFCPGEKCEFPKFCR